MGGISIPLNSIATQTPIPQIERAAEIILPVAASPIPASAPAPVPEAAPRQEERKLPIVLEQPNLRASFEYDRQLHTIIITLQREDNGETVRQIPPEQMLRTLARIVDTLNSELDLQG